jgi:hypothetical protein
MEALLTLLSLRPIVTRSVLPVIWYLYLLATVIQLGQFNGLSISLIGRADTGGNYHLSLLPPILFGLAHLALVRVFLEVISRLLTQSPRQPRSC